MSDSNAEKNKAIVLKAFDTLFNKRDYTAAERFWSPNYIQHSAHIEPGRDGSSTSSRPRRRRSRMSLG
jgi:predicted SnoaL-like aldol condensation-catalyzing enzyme